MSIHATCFRLYICFHFTVTYIQRQATLNYARHASQYLTCSCWPSETWILKQLLMTFSCVKTPPVGCSMYVICRLTASCNSACGTAVYNSVVVCIVCTAFNHRPIKACSNRHETEQAVNWHDREAMLCGLSIFKKAVWSLYILFMCGLASFKREQADSVTNCLLEQINFCCWSERRRRRRRTRKSYRLFGALWGFVSSRLRFSLHGDNKERSHRASKDIMIFYLEHRHNGVESKTRTVVLQEKGLYTLREGISQFFSGMITNSMPETCDYSSCKSAPTGLFDSPLCSLSFVSLIKAIHYLRDLVITVIKYLQSFQNVTFAGPACRRSWARYIQMTNPCFWQASLFLLPRCMKQVIFSAHWIFIHQGGWGVGHWSLRWLYEALRGVQERWGWPGMESHGTYCLLAVSFYSTWVKDYVVWSDACSTRAGERSQWDITLRPLWWKSLY